MNEETQGQRRTIGSDQVIELLTNALDKAGIPTGNEHSNYSLIQRLDYLIGVKNYFVRQTDEARAASKNLEEILYAKF